MNLFLDTNVYLSFYKMSGDDVEELRKLSVMIQAEETTLYLPDQTKAEFLRNRESTIAKSLRYLEESALPRGFPRLFIGHPGFEGLQVSLNEFETQRKELLSQVRGAAQKKALPADKLIEELFGLAQPIPLSQAIWNKAQKRSDLGNPPGKDDSIGDAVNWESLLAVVPAGEDIFIVTSDTDFMSQLEPGQLSEFLRGEWVEKKQSDASAYGSLSDLFRDRFPNIKMASELQKELLISRLVRSESFVETHSAIANLSGYSDFSSDQARALIQAANENTQITWILQDQDAFAFFTRVATSQLSDLDPEDVAEFWNNVNYQLGLAGYEAEDVP